MARKQLLLMSLFFPAILCIGACGSSKDSYENVKGSIISLTMDHVIEKRDWCRFSKIILSLELSNKGLDTFELVRPRRINFCDPDDMPLDFWLKLRTDLNPCFSLGISKDSCKNAVVAVTFPNGIILYPDSTIKVDCMLLDEIYGGSLEQIKSLYSNMINSDFTLELSRLIGGNNQFLISKSDNFKVVLKLDDEIVEKGETMKLKKSLMSNLDINSLPDIPSSE